MNTWGARLRIGWGKTLMLTSRQGRMVIRGAALDLFFGVPDTMVRVYKYRGREQKRRFRSARTGITLRG